MREADLSFLINQSERTTTEIAGLRDDMSGLSAIVLRLDGSMAALLQQSSARNQAARLNERISEIVERLRRLEDQIKKLEELNQRLSELMPKIIELLGSD